MRILAIDATQRRGVVSASLQTAVDAARTAGADVTQVRLSELDVRFCTGCKMCQMTGSCKIDDDLPSLAQSIAEADGVIFGTRSYFRKPDETTRAVLDRLAGYFGRNAQLRLPGMSPAEIPYSPHVRETKRAIIITACAAPEPLATFFGYTTGPVRELRGAFGHGGIRTLGSLTVTNTWLHPQVEEWEQDKARSLGRMLAGKI